MTNEFVNVAKVSDIPEGTVKICNAAGQHFLVCNVGQSFYAVADICSHDNGPLGEGELVDHLQIECPRHGARFDLTTGKAMCLPAVTPIPAYQTEVRGEDVWVSLPSAS